MSDVRYGSTIVLKHCVTGRFLSQNGLRYSHADSSMQKQVTAIESISSRAMWIVKSPHDIPLDMFYGRPLINANVIRLENRSEQSNLHSHIGRPAPVTTSQQEVTGFGNNGEGDVNDNWRIEVEGGGVWQSQSRIRLIHSMTNAALHSHVSRSPQFTNNEQEVTAMHARDENDWWVIESSINPVVPLFTNPSSRAYPWINLLNLVSSIASVSGVTIIVIGSELSSSTIKQRIAIAMAVLFEIGISTLVLDLSLTIYQNITLRRRKSWLRCWYWCLAAPIGLTFSIAIAYFLAWLLREHSSQIRNLQFNVIPGS